MVDASEKHKRVPLTGIVLRAVHSPWLSLGDRATVCRSPPQERARRTPSVVVAPNMAAGKRVARSYERRQTHATTAGVETRVPSPPPGTGVWLTRVSPRRRARRRAPPGHTRHRTRHHAAVAGAATICLTARSRTRPGCGESGRRPDPFRAVRHCPQHMRPSRSLLVRHAVPMESTCCPHLNQNHMQRSPVRVSCNNKTRARLTRQAQHPICVQRWHRPRLTDCL